MTVDFDRNGMRLLDMHAHPASFLEERFEQELTLRKKHGILTCFSAGTPEEYRFLQAYGGRKEILCSFGIHPWNSDRYRPEDCREQFENCRIIGEIGMDSLWTDIDLSVQRKVFEQQLQIAADLNKPIVLHTKDQEEEIAEMIRDFPAPVLVHWYSGSLKHLEKYLQKNCFFTIGPDIGTVLERAQSSGQEMEKRERYLYMLREIPGNRLFTETDGISAVAWAKGAEQLPTEEIPAVLRESMGCLSAEKKTSEEELRRQMLGGLEMFLGRNTDGPPK